MTYSEQDYRTLRLMTGEADEGSVYTDEDLALVLDAASGDLNAAAGDICTWKAAAFAGEFDFDADGGKYVRSQRYQHWVDEANRYYARAGFVVDLVGEDV